MPLEILLCHRSLSPVEKKESTEYATNFEQLKSLLTVIAPTSHYVIKTLLVNPNVRDMGRHPLINLNHPIVILYDYNNPGYHRIDDLYNYVALFEKAKYVVIVHLYDPTHETHNQLQESFQFWRTAYKGHPLEERISDMLVIDKNATAASLSILIGQVYANFSELTELTDNQAIIILQSLQNLLKRGPLNDISKPYDITFGGVKYSNDSTYPSHIHALLNKITQALSCDISQAKQHLFQIVNDIKQTAINLEKPFSRSSSTHHFYVHTLPLFIARSIIKENINAKEHISRLSEENAQEILNDLFGYLIKDVYGNIRNYRVGFFGGKNYELLQENRAIKVPTHVHQLLNLIQNQNPTSHKEKLSNIFDEIMLAADSKCFSRKDFTRNLYTSMLPHYIVNKISKIHPEINRDRRELLP